MGKKDDTSSSKGKSYQTNHTYFFVPAALGKRDRRTADDTNVPGAILRLGGYSDLEAKAEEADKLDQFYPREYGDDLVDDDTGQILLSGGGQMLVRARGKMFINSDEEMDIDSIGDLRVNSDGKTKITSEEDIDIESRKKPITIISGPGQNITISAGKDSKGDIIQNCYNETRQIGGDSYTVVTDNTYTLTQANQVSITMGGSSSTTLGGTFAFFLGASASIKVAVSLSVNTVASLSYNTAWIGLNVLSTTYNVFAFTASAVNADKFDAKAEITNLKADVGALGTSTSQIKSDQRLVYSCIGSISNIISMQNSM